MTNRLMCVIALAAVMVSAACSNPAAPSPSGGLPSPLPPVTMTMTDGDGQRISGVTVLVDGQPVTPNAAGQYSAAQRHALDITAPNFIARQSTTAEGVFSLIDLRRLSGVGGDQAYWQTMVYGVASQSNVLTRPSRGQVFRVSLSAELENDGIVSRSLDVSVPALDVVANGFASFTRVASGQGNVTMVVDSNDKAFVQYPTAGAVTYNTVQGNTIASANIVFKSVEMARYASLQTHEMGHVLGLGHSVDSREIMFSGNGGIPNTVIFSPRLRYVVAMMFQRKSGTAYPDNDRQAVGSLDRTRHTVVIVN